MLGTQGTAEVAGTWMMGLGGVWGRGWLHGEVYVMMAGGCEGRLAVAGLAV